MSSDEPTSNTTNDHARNPVAQTQAERSKAYRERRQAEGLKAVKCFLAPDQLAYLSALCKIHKITIAEAISMALTSLITGEAGTPSGLSEDISICESVSPDKLTEWLIR